MSRRRRGKSLIEALVAMSLLAAALAASTTTLAALFRMESLIRRDVEQAAAIDRLSQRLRADAHAAVACRTEGNCVLTMADGREVHYAAASPVVTREVLGGDKLVHRDAFYLPKDAMVRFETAPEAGGKLVRMLIHPPDMTAAGAPPTRATTILAAIHVQAEPFQRNASP
jgi:hypothetical protein